MIIEMEAADRPLDRRVVLVYPEGQQQNIVNINIVKSTLTTATSLSL